MQARFRFHRLVALLGVLSLWVLSSCSGPELPVGAGLVRPPSAGEVTPDPRQGRAVVALWLSASNPRIAKDTAQQFGGIDGLVFPLQLPLRSTEPLVLDHAAAIK